MPMLDKTVFVECLRQALKPLIRYCLKRSITIQEVLESVKAVFIEEAAEDLERRKERINSSRLCVATGLHRMEVLRLWKQGPKEASPHYATRVIGQWLSDRRYVGKSGRPLVLSHDGEDCEFNKLVRTVCLDVHPGTVLFELERVGAVERTRDGIKLLMKGYLPKGNPEEGYKLFARDAGHLLETVEENVFDTPKPANLHVRTDLDNINQDSIDNIRKWLFEQGNAFHEKARKFLSKHDLDITPKKNAKGGVRVVLGSFSRVVEPAGK